MLPPLPAGILLHQRYKIESVLTQNPSSNTYLAEDLAELTAPVVLEEIHIPPTDLSLLVSKRADRLREAESLRFYTDNPSLPRFLESFCERNRIFLVRPYIVGLTLQKYSGDISENTLIVWLEALLKSLNKLHQANVYYNNISPENIVIESESRLPVLISFSRIEVLGGVNKQPHAYEYNKSTVAQRRGK